MRITYLCHSGFFVELQKHVLLFDYYTGEKTGKTQEWKLPAWDGKKQACVFVSHGHHDHFDMSVFALAKEYPNIHYFLGFDITLSERYLERSGAPATIKGKITNIPKNGSLQFGDVAIETLCSTDEGAAFIVETEGECFYHAGDLNWWHWEGEPAAYLKNMERDYKSEIDKIAGKHMSAAFVPLDPRLGEAYRYGIDYFLSKVSAEYVFPMHMWGHYSLIAQYKNSLRKEKAQDARIASIMEMKRPGESFALKTVSGN